MYSNLLEISTPLRTPVASAAESQDRYLGERWVEVLVDCPGAQGLYTYAVSPTLSVRSGDILSVPFGAQQVGAVAIQLLTQPSADVDLAAIRPVEEVISHGFFPPTYWKLLQRVAQYYCTPLIQVVRVALPPGLLGRSQRRIRLTSAVPPSAEVLLPPAAQQILTLLQAQKQGDYSWHYLQRQVRGASRGLTDLLQRGWVESYLEPPTLVRPKQRQAVTLTHQPPSAPLSSQQQEILTVLRRQGGEMWLQDLLQQCQISSSVVKTLERKGCVVIRSQEVLRLDAAAPVAPDQAKALTTAQAEALANLNAITGYAQVLLHGVTGSGKTEIYLQAIAPVLQQGKSALVLVPEIGLTPQLTDRFRARFGAAVHVYHSALSDGERYDTWRQMLDGTPQVLIGTRSAVFAPLPQLGLIILDEEHDGSFKQDQPAPCYHARTVAQWRAELVNCPLILGSATPCLESWIEAGGREGREDGEDREDISQLFLSPSSPPPPSSPSSPPSPSSSPSPSSPPPSLYLSLPHRIHDRPMPPIEVVDMRQELKQGNRSIFSRSLQDALQTMHDRQQQGLLFIHRRGHSTFVSCRSCGHVMECPHCDVSLTYHQTQIGGYESLRCHYCGYGQTHPSRCPVCDAPYLKHFGSGTQRVMQELAQHFPSLRCLRFDSDTTRAKGAHRALLSRFAAGEADILVGTQMLTKGIDLPQVTLVGVVAADGLLHLADFRASERAFQVLTQVAGRAGRGDDPGRVILQTYSPQHPVIEAVVRQNYPLFAETELQHRQALRYPPYGRLIAYRFSGFDAEVVPRTATALADYLRSHLESELTTSAAKLEYELLGPAPAAIVRVSRRYRWQLLLKIPIDAPVTLPTLAELRSHCPAGVSLTIDVDPLRLL
jgi:primosomal protein N' (replication factor Y) (superfamily II helicase)